MAARTGLPRISRVSAVALVAFGVFVGSLLPVAAQEEPEAAAVVELPEFEAAAPSIPAHAIMPEGLDGESDFSRFEYAWQSEFTALEAAMIAAAEDRHLMPSIPADSGSGERVVYSLSRQRVWMVADNGYLIDSYLVSGRDWMPNVGTFRVWGKARRTQGYDPLYTMNWMVRFAVGSHGGNIGFHDLPLYAGRPVQTLDELGVANLSGGCVRQDPYHARMMYAWAEIGTVVVVIP